MGGEAACRRPNKTPHIDHCHETKKVRGLLCGRCNYLLGVAQDNPLVLARAALYLAPEEFK